MNKLQAFPRDHCDGKVLPKPALGTPTRGLYTPRNKSYSNHKYSQYFINIVILSGVQSLKSESLCCTPVTYIILCINYASIKEKKKRVIMLKFPSTGFTSKTSLWSLDLFSFFFLIFMLYWHIVDLQSCVSFRGTAK